MSSCKAQIIKQAWRENQYFHHRLAIANVQLNLDSAHHPSISHDHQKLSLSLTIYLKPRQFEQPSLFKFPHKLYGQQLQLYVQKQGGIDALGYYKPETRGASAQGTVVAMPHPFSNVPVMNSTERFFFNDLEKKLWTAADKLRSNLDAAVYKHVVLGLIFLKYVSDAFEERHKELCEQFQNPDHDYPSVCTHLFAPWQDAIQGRGW